MRTSLALFPLLFCALLASPVAGQEEDEHDELAPDPAVAVDAEAREVSFAAVVARLDGPLEVLLCGPHGRAHETLLAATVDPEALAEGLSSLGLTPASEWAESERELFALQGDKVLVWIELPGGRRVAAEDMILNDYEKRPMRPRGWTFHARRFGQGLPGEVEFTLTFKGLRGSPLSMLDSAHAYRPFANAPLVVRTAAVPVPAEGQKVLAVRVVLAPTDEVGIVRLGLEQEGAPPADDEGAALLAAAREVDRLKERLAGIDGADELAVARRRQLALEVETAYFVLDLLHEARERRAIEGRAERDAQLDDWKAFVAEILTTYRDSSTAEAMAAGAEVRVLELRAEGADEVDIERQLLIAEEAMARVEALNLRPKLGEARHFVSQATSDASRGRYQAALEYVEARLRIAEARGRRAALRREALDAPDERRTAIDAELAAAEAAIAADERDIRRYTLDRELAQLRSDRRLYSDPKSAVYDEARAAAIGERIEALEQERAALDE